MSVLNSEIESSTFNLQAHPILECANRIVGLAREGRIDISRRLGEGSLTTRLSTSRATVRSALDHLELSGLVKRVSRAGTFLVPVGPQEFCHVMDIRASLESLAARLASGRARPIDIDRLHTAAVEVDALNLRLIDGDQDALTPLSRIDHDFHLSIAQLSGNPRLALTLTQQRLIEQSFHVKKTHSILYNRRDRPVPSHLAIVEAIASRDADAADAVIRQHILRTKELQLGSFTGEIA